MNKINIEEILAKYDMPKHDWQYENMYKAIKEACDKTVDMCASTAWYEYSIPGWITDKEEIIAIKESIK